MTEATLELVIANSKNSLPLFDFPVLYFLLDGEEIVYIGQSSSLAGAWGRVHSHKKDGKVFNGYSFFKLEGDPNTAEAIHIVKFTPKYNFQLPTQDIWKPIGTLAEIIGITPGRFKKMLSKKGVRPITGFNYFKVDEVMAAEVGL